MILDRQAVALLIPVMALAIPVTAIVFGSLVKMAKLKADAQRGPLASPDTDNRLAALEDEVVTLREDLSETQERLDFTERLLAQKSSAKD
jgi:hypothetical protein